MNKTKRFEVTSMGLHFLAMGFMLLDHTWATLIPDNQWLTNAGRLAFPIFAFMIVEGYFYTSDLKKYVKRLFGIALLSEIPFNIMTSSSLINPFEQNVIWTYLIGILLIHLNEKAKKENKTWVSIFVGIGTILLGFILGTLAMADYYYAGIFIILTFYFFRGRSWQNFLAQLIILSYIYFSLMLGLSYEVSIFNTVFEINQQGFAILAQIPIWLYQGRQG
ncbi:MAG TPA: TraX family protein, partial [Erysipelotrichaceae bacterium]|nr:TraX family protein [Erysipelotrichaceae bacterium]